MPSALTCQLGTWALTSGNNATFRTPNCFSLRSVEKISLLPSSSLGSPQADKTWKSLVEPWSPVSLRGNRSLVYLMLVLRAELVSISRPHFYILSPPYREAEAGGNRDVSSTANSWGWGRRYHQSCELQAGVWEQLWAAWHGLESLSLPWV